MKLAGLCGFLAVLAIVLGADCGAMTLEPAPPEEPVPEAAALPRLVRRDASTNQGESADPQ